MAMTKPEAAASSEAAHTWAHRTVQLLNQALRWPRSWRLHETELALARKTVGKPWENHGKMEVYPLVVSKYIAIEAMAG